MGRGDIAKKLCPVSKAFILILLFLQIAVFVVYSFMTGERFGRTREGDGNVFILNFGTVEKKVHSFAAHAGELAGKLRRIPTKIQNFQTKNKDFDNIPKIIHQTYKSKMIPNAYKEGVKSCLTTNPDWTYMFWSDEDGIKLVKEKYPKYLSLLNGYEHYRYHRLLRADVLRYFILYHYGGVYLDMDFDCLKPFDKLRNFGSCLLTPEVHVQSFMIYKIPSLISNAIMIAKPRHPFFRHVIDNLEAFMTPGQQVVIRLTGPIAMQKMLDDYEQKPCKEKMCNVTVLDPLYLLPTADRAEYPKIVKFVGNTCNKSELTKSEDQVCKWTKVKQFHRNNNSIPAEAFTNHLWMHLEYFKLSNAGRTSIDTIVYESSHAPAQRYRND